MKGNAGIRHFFIPYGISIFPGLTDETEQKNNGSSKSLRLFREVYYKQSDNVKDCRNMIHELNLACQAHPVAVCHSPFHLMELKLNPAQFFL